MRDDAMDQPHTRYFRMIEDVLGSLGITLLRVTSPGPRAARPRSLHRDLLSA
jgi:hypothetical protein